MKEQIKGHQGDVQFKTISDIPSDFIKVENKPLAVSEASGHAHVLTGNVERYEQGERVIYNVIEDSRIQHTNISLMNEKTYSSNAELPIEDHKPHLLPIGIYEFFIQQSYNPYKKLMEKAID